jgi:predicted Fe-Mo cluster-binding NifX family protein
MRIAVASSGRTMTSAVDPRFGRCPYFLIVDSETMDFEAVENQAGQATRGAGISAAQVIANKKVTVAIAGNFGPNAVNVLTASGVKIFGGVSGMTVKEAVEKYQTDELTETDAATTPSGMGMGRGRGGGGGWKRKR